MDAAMKARWVAALRSGDYKQGRGALKFYDAEATYHCCLGVLCELDDRVTERPHDAAYQCAVFQYGDLPPGVSVGAVTHHGYLPGNLQADLGITEDQMYTLAHMNDVGNSFDRIADWIEANL